MRRRLKSGSKKTRLHGLRDAKNKTCPARLRGSTFSDLNGRRRDVLRAINFPAAGVFHSDLTVSVRKMYLRFCCGRFAPA